jgi:hypothetical protein
MKITPAGDLSSAEPVLPVRWCLEPGEAKQLKADLAKNIHVLFVIAYGADPDAYQCASEDRVLVPIEQMMTYLSFRRPGKCTVFATVVWGDSVKRLRQICLTLRRRGTYVHNLLWSGGLYGTRDWHGDMEALHINAGARLEVVVPVEHFPKEPPAWLWRTVNFQFAYPPVDQCSFRRRCLLSPLRLPWFGLWAVITTVIRAAIAACAGLHGCRHINFGAILHPWRNDINDVTYCTDIRNTWVLCDEHGHARSRWLLLLHPYVYVALFAVVAIVKAQYGVTYWAAIVMIAGAVVKAVLIVVHSLLAWWYVWLILAAGVGSVYGVEFLAVRRKESLRAAEKRRERETGLTPKDRWRLEEEAKYDQLARSLACQAMPLEVNLHALPPDKQTFLLRYLDLKRRICRPYAG